MATALSSPVPSSDLQNMDDGKKEGGRRSAGFHPSIWGDHFLSYSPDQNQLDGWTARREALKEEVKKILSSARGSPQELDLIDAIERLGVAYHFEKEIEEALHQIFLSDAYADSDDLHVISLRFRLIRQQGYKASSDTFRKFKDEEGNFKASLAKDAKGMLSLYEAAFLSINGDDILDEAVVFTKGHLKSAVTSVDSHLAEKIKRALEVPLHKRIQRLENRFYIPVYEQDKEHHPVILEFAKLDFNLLQSVHQRELMECTKWWKEVDFPTHLPFIRDRLVECYYWILGVYYTEDFSRARIFSTKMTILVSVLDDIFDVYATEDELELFTDQINRWDLEGLDRLPGYLRHFFLVMYDCVKHLEDELEPEGCSYRGYYVKDAMKVLARDYFVEHKWCNRNIVPSLEEYIRVSVISVAVHMANVHCCAGMGDIISREAFEWLKTEPKVVMDASLVGRFLDDLQSTDFEQKRGHVASAVQCYMNEYGVTYQEAAAKLRVMAVNLWKDINEACLKPTVFPLHVFLPAINLARVAEVIYLYGDGYTHSTTDTKANINMMLVDSIPV